MPWFKVDDGFHGHPKVLDLSITAVGVWTLAGSWCAKYLTDGHVPSRALARLGGTSEIAAELVAAGLWFESGDGFQFKDWEDYQPLKSEVEAERLAAQERMKKVRAAKKGVRANDSRTDPERSGERQANVRAKFGRSSEEVRVAPSQSHPDPVPTTTSNEVVTSTSEVADATIRPDVLQLIEALETELAANGSKIPARSKTNLDAARLLLDRDGHTVDQVLRAIRWCQADEFWRGNILSMSKLREKYDQLRLHAQRQRGERSSMTKADENAAKYYEIYGGDDGERTRSVPAIDAGIRA